MKNILLRIALIVSILVLIAAIAGGVLYFISPSVITGILFGFNYMVFVIGGVDLVLLILLILSLRISNSFDIRSCYINAGTEQESKKKFKIKQIVRIVLNVDGADDMIRTDYYGISLDAEGETLRVRLLSACDVGVIDRFKKDLESALLKAYDIVIPNYRFIAKSVVYSYTILDSKSKHKLFNDKLIVTATAASDEPTVSDKSRVLAIISKADKQDHMIAGATYNEGIENLIDIALKDDYDVAGVDALKCRIEKSLYDDLSLVVSKYKFSGKDSVYNYEITDTAKQHKLFSDKLVVTTSSTIGGKGKIDKELVFECIETADKEDPIVLTDEDYIEFDEDGDYLSIILTTDNSVDQVDSFKCRIEGLLRKHGIVFSKYIFNSNEREYIFTILDDKYAHSLYNDTLIVTEATKDDSASDEIAAVAASEESAAADESVLFTSSADVVSAIYGSDDTQKELPSEEAEQEHTHEQESLFADDLIFEEEYIQPEEDFIRQESGIFSEAETLEGFMLSEEPTEAVSEIKEDGQVSMFDSETGDDGLVADAVESYPAVDKTTEIVSCDETGSEAEVIAKEQEPEVVETSEAITEGTEQVIQSAQEDTLVYAEPIDITEQKPEEEQISKAADIEDQAAPVHLEEPILEANQETALEPETKKPKKGGKKGKKAAAVIAGGVAAATVAATVIATSSGDGIGQEEQSEIKKEEAEALQHEKTQAVTVEAEVLQPEPVEAEQGEQNEPEYAETFEALQAEQNEPEQEEQAVNVQEEVLQDNQIEPEQIEQSRAEQAETFESEPVEADQTEPVETEQAEVLQAEQLEAEKNEIASEYLEQTAAPEHLEEPILEESLEISREPEIKKPKKGGKKSKKVAVIAGGAAAVAAAVIASSGGNKSVQEEQSEFIQEEQAVTENAEPVKALQDEQIVEQAEPVQTEQTEDIQTEQGATEQAVPAVTPIAEAYKEQDAVSEAAAVTAVSSPQPIVEADGNEYIYVKEGEQFDPDAYGGELVKVGEDYIYEEEIVYEEVPIDEEEEQAGSEDPEEQYRKKLTLDIMSSIMEINGGQEADIADEKVSSDKEGDFDESAQRNEENLRRVKEKVRQERESAMTTAAVKTSQSRSRTSNKASKSKTKPTAKTSDTAVAKDTVVSDIQELKPAEQAVRPATKLVPVIKTKLTKREIYAIKRDIMKQTKELLDIIEEIDPNF